MSIGIIDSKIKYMKVTAKAKGGIFDPYALKHPRYEAWQKFLAEYD